MRQVHARGWTVPQASAIRGWATSRSGYPGGLVPRLLAFALGIFAAGCASGSTPDAPAGEPEPANPGSETSPTTTGAIALVPATEPNASAPAPAAGIFSEAQADRGRTAFDEVCSDCHTTSEFRGRTFQSNWGRRTVYSFFRTIRSTMPDDNPGGLDEQTYLDVVSYILRINGHGAGATEMTADSPMREVRMAPPDSTP